MTASISRIFLVLASVAVLLCATLARSAPLLPFDAQTLDALKAAHTSKPFLLVFWSLHCEPCRDEMSNWSALRDNYPQVAIVLVSADATEERDAVAAYLTRHDLTGIATYAFADDFAERIRFAVDRKWRGELPRTYLFDAQHRPKAHSGRMTPARMANWMAPRD
jgi:thiol-disulfide isomerase/thioredoxin